MSKGTIVSGGTDGEYSVDVELDAVAIQNRITLLTTRKTNAEIAKTSAEAVLADLQAEYDALIAEQNALIDILNADKTEENLKALQAKSRELVPAAANVAKQSFRVKTHTLEITGLSAEIARLTSVPSSVNATLWCADFTEDLTGEVGLVEVPGGERGKHLQVLPGHGGVAAYSAARDGALRKPFADDPAGTYYNLALLPGWQKWYPRYRLGVIAAIDYDLDTCNLSISNAASLQQGIDVNHLTEYTDVPIEYMACDSAVFEVGDTVLCEFVSQTISGVESNWDQGNLKVIGFASNPRECNTLVLERGLAIVVGSGLRIYTSSDLAAEWGGSPQDWGWETTPGVGETPHAQGLMSAGTGSCTGSGAPTWAGAPALDGSDSYAPSSSGSALTTWVNDPDRDPSKYTGLIRLAVQAFGPHRTISALRPGSWPSWDPRWYGIVRQRDTAATTLRWWLVYLGPAGCRCVALQHDAIADCLVEGLYDGIWGPDQAMLAEAYLLRSLTLPSGATGDEVLTTAEVSNAHGSGYSPFVHGWHFSPQKWGSVSETSTDAVIATKKDNGAGWDTRGCQVTVSFTGTTPSAVFATPKTGSPNFGTSCHLWYPVGAEHKRITSHSGLGTAGFVWARYTPSGPDWRDYDGQGTTTATYNSTVLAYNECGQGSARDQGWVYSGSVSQGGWGGDFAGQFERIVGSGTWRTTTYWEIATAPIDDVFFSGLYSAWTGSGGDPGAVCEVLGFAGDGCGAGCSRPAATVMKSRHYFDYETISVSGGGGNGACLIIGQDPTTFILASDVSKQVGSGGSTFYAGSQTGALSITVSGVGGQCTGCNGTHKPSTGQVNSSGNIGSKSNVSWVDGGGTNFTRTARVFQTIGASTRDPSGDRAEFDWLYFTNAKLFAGDAIIDLWPGEGGEAKMHSDWLCWTRPTDTACGSVSTLTGLVDRVGYGGDVLYTSYPGADLESNAGYHAATVAAADAVRFIGLA